MRWTDYSIHTKRQRALTDDQVREIRSRHKKGESITSISKDFPVSRDCISHVVNNKNYKDVK